MKILNFTMVIKAKLYVVTLLLFSLMINSANATTLTVKEREAAKLARQQAYKAEQEAGRRDRLKEEYGFTDAEVDKFMELSDAQKVKLQSISADTSLSKDLKRSTMQKAIEDYHQMLSTHLTSMQYSIFKTKIANAQAKAKTEREIDKLSQECRKELSQMSSIPAEQRDQKRKEIVAKYTVEFSKYLDQSKAEKLALSLYHERVAISRGADKDKLSKAELVAVGRVLANNQTKKDSIVSLDIWYKGKNKKRNGINERQAEKIASMIDDKAASEIAIREERTHKQRYIEDYGLTNEQYNKLKEIENKYAVGRMVIVKSAIPIEEKQTKVKRIYWQKITQIKQLVPSDKQEEWMEFYRRHNKPKLMKITGNN